MLGVALYNPAVINAFKGKAVKVGSEQTNGQISLSGEGESPSPRDLSGATRTLSPLLNEQSGKGELAHAAPNTNFLPLTLQVRHHGKVPSTMCETPVGVEP